MDRKKLNEAIVEAQRFIARARQLPPPQTYSANGHQYESDNFPKQTGAIRRASMDLTRALAELRKSG